jgi:hypothetical protein
LEQFGLVDHTVWSGDRFRRGAGVKIDQPVTQL